MPKIGSSGEKYRDKQLAYQLPRQDLTINYCKHVDTEHRASYDDFIAARNEIALDVGFVRDAPTAGKCQMCSESISQGEMCIAAPKLSDEVRNVIQAINRKQLISVSLRNFSSIFIPAASSAPRAKSSSWT